MKNDLIRRQAAIEAIINCTDIFVNNLPTMMYKTDAQEAINEVPSVQPEIIRCEDCRWWKDQSGSTAWLPCMEIMTWKDFYCGMAERKKDEN